MGMTPGVPGAPEPRMYPRSGYFLVIDKRTVSIKRTVQNYFQMTIKRTVPSQNWNHYNLNDLVL